MMRIEPRTVPVAAPAAARGTARGWRLALGAAALVSGGLFLAELLRVVVGSNFHVAVPGLAYRISQPTPEEIEAYCRTLGIRTVLSLRGGTDGTPWYDAQGATCQKLGVDFESLTFSAGRLPHPGELSRLAEALDRAPTPLLIHCRQGADRTGLAAAMVRLLRTDATLAEARTELGLRTGHWRWGSAGAMGRTLDLYESWLAKDGVAHSPERFRRWATSEYAKAVPRQQVTSAERLGEPRVGASLAYRVTYRNDGPAPWRFRSIPRAGTEVGLYVNGLDDGFAAELRFGHFEREVAPGESLEVVVPLPVFRKLGRYRLRFDLIDARHSWFAQMGSEPWEEELVVRE